MRNPGHQHGGHLAYSAPRWSTSVRLTSPRSSRPRDSPFCGSPAISTSANDHIPCPGLRCTCGGSTRCRRGLEPSTHAAGPNGYRLLPRLERYGWLQRHRQHPLARLRPRRTADSRLLLGAKPRRGDVIPAVLQAEMIRSMAHRHWFSACRRVVHESGGGSRRPEFFYATPSPGSARSFSRPLRAPAWHGRAWWSPPCWLSSPFILAHNETHRLVSRIAPILF